MTQKIVEAYHTTDEKGAKIVKIPIANTEYYATLYADDFKELMAMGVSPRWSYYSGHVKAVANSKTYCVARALMDATKGEQVKYLNGDRFDLRRDNLVIARGGKS